MDVHALFTQKFNHPPSLSGWSPGRVNLLGEHIDYNDGVVLPAAIDRAVRLAGSRVEVGLVSLHASDLQQAVVFSLDNLTAKVDLDGRPLPNWALYPAGVAWALQEHGLEVCGLEAVYTSDVPIGAGLSSSAAVEVGFAALWQALCGWRADRLSLARLCQRAENAYVGVSCGLMDQFACANGVAGHALAFDTRSLEWQPVPLPAETALVIADSGVRRNLGMTAYNERRAACEQAVEILRQVMPHIQALRDVKSTEFVAYEDRLPPLVRRRAEHVVKEIARVEAAIIALQRGETRSFGALMYAGHASLRDLYEVSTPELDTLVKLARSLPGCYGARLTGAGFGGCTVNLVAAGEAGRFIQGLQQGYQEATGRQAQVYLCQASQGATITNIETAS